MTAPWSAYAGMRLQPILRFQTIALIWQTTTRCSKCVRHMHF